MSYRNITVDDKTYKFSVGKTHTKIQGHGHNINIANDQIGQPTVGLKCRYYIPVKNIATFIKQGFKGIVRQEHCCSQHVTITDEVTYDPYTLSLIHI